MKKVFGTTEWAATNANCINGCSHDCWYCYAKTMAIRFHRKEIDTWKIEENVSLKKIGKRVGRVMFPTTHDITPNNWETCFNYLQMIFNKGNEVLIVTKPHLEIIEKLTNNFKFFKDKILFRFTIGSHITEDLLLWEPGATSFEERFYSLKHAYSEGFQTSISSEPMLSLNMEPLINLTSPYVTDCIWLGLLNKAQLRLKYNGAPEHVFRLANTLSKHWTDERVKSLYEQYKNNRKIKWKESIKKIAGIEVPTIKGLDI